MGNHRSCLTSRGVKASQQTPTGSIVPDQDPLLRAVTRRVVHAEISRDFELTPQVLGTGYSGAVRLAEHRTTRQHVAVKQFTKRRLKAHRLKLLQSEVEVYLRLDHPNICRLLHAYEGKHEVWLVMELCGCELYSRLCQRKVYRERDAADVMLQMLQAVSYLHSHRIVHRDLKLENWMYGATARDDRLKLIDFGFSRRLISEEEVLDMPCGTLHYTSPEVLSRKYTSSCDMWSLGVICYMLLLGRPPFRGQNNVKIAKAILSGDFPRDGRYEALSPGARDFVESLLQKDATRRLDASRALSHRWILEAANAAASSSSSSGSPVAGLSSAEGSSPMALAAGKGELGPDVLRSLRKFARGSHLQRAALTVLAYSLTSREIQDFEQAFLDMDTSGRGTITLEQLAEVMKRYPEVSSQEVQRIFECVDVSNDEEIHYTPFIAAMLATRVRLHEDKVRAAFEAFDTEGSGFITAEALARAFNGSLGAGASPPEVAQAGGMTKFEAEQWIREVDYKGNGVIDYEEFLAALMGKHLWAVPPLDESADHPTVRVFEEATQGSRPRIFSETDHVGLTSRIRHGLASVIIDGDEIDRQRSQSFSPGMRSDPLQVRNVSCDVDERYFA